MMVVNVYVQALTNNENGPGRVLPRRFQRLSVRGDEEGQGIRAPTPLLHVGIIKSLHFTDIAESFFPRLHPWMRRRRTRAGSEKKKRFYAHDFSTTSTRRSRKAVWASLIFSFAVPIEKNSARSISGNCCMRREHGGHSISKVL